MSVPESISKLHRFESFLQADPTNQMLITDLVNLYVETGQIRDAIALLQRPEITSLKSSKIQLKLANLFVGERRWKEAHNIYQEVSNLGFDSADFRFAYGLTFFFQDQFADARDQWLKAVEQGMDYVDLWKYLAHSYHHLFQMNEAIDTCLKWVKSSDNSDESRTYLCLLYFDANFMVESCAIAKELLKADSDSLVGHIVMGSFALENHEADIAHDHFLKAVAHTEGTGRAWLGLGLSQLYLQRYPDAVNSLRRAELEMPLHTGTVIALGWVLLITNVLNEAENCFRKSIEIDRNFAEAHGGLASVLVQLGRIDEAKFSIEIANKLNPQCFGVVYARAALLQLDGKPEVAEFLFRRAMERSANSAKTPLSQHLQLFITQTSKMNRSK